MTCCALSTGAERKISVQSWTGASSDGLARRQRRGGLETQRTSARYGGRRSRFTISLLSVIAQRCRKALQKTESSTSVPCVDLGPENEDEMKDPSILQERLQTENNSLPFTINDIRKAIPKHCFQRSAVRSFAYLIRDVVAIGALVYASTFIDTMAVSSIVKNGILWPSYWFGVGAFAFGLWIVAHECGHGAFSEHNWLNDLVGFFAHSVLLVPYFSWKHSHRRHHTNTGSMSKDEVFVPDLSDLHSEHPLIDAVMIPPIRLFLVLVMCTAGFPLYLALHWGGRKYKDWPNHFNPWSPVFKKKERFEIFLSDLGLAAVIGGLYIMGQNFGFACVLKTYIIPYFVVHAWLVVVTFLHHSHPSCPHYDDNEWYWLKGALSTIDRDFGFLNVIFHRITDTHVLHHLFAQIPHYHAIEATEAIKPILGDYYNADRRNFLHALWEDYGNTRVAAVDQSGKSGIRYRTIEELLKIKQLS